MSDHEKELEALDRLLEEAAKDPAIAAIQERAEDSGHVDDETLDKVLAGELEGEELTNVRRHLLFCDDCTKLALGRGGELGDAAAPTAKPPRARLSIPKIPLVLILVVALAASVVLLVIEPPPPPQMRLRSAALHSFERGLLEPAIVRPGEEVALALEVAHAPRPLHVYVLAQTPDGVWHVLEPREANAAPMAFVAPVWLPAGSRPGAPGERPSWRLGTLARMRTGDSVGLFVFLSRQRISVFEDDMLAAVTLPNFERDHVPENGRYDRDHIRRVGEKLEALGLADLVITVPVRIEPL